MEKKVDSLVFTRMTYADFKHINKRGGEEKGGGGQSYIDFPVAEISLEDWYRFLGERTGTGASGRPQWDFLINSLSINNPIRLRMYQRRQPSVTIASQKIHSRRSNRVPVWHPENGFPEEYNPEIENLVLYIVKTKDNEFWAGWFLQSEIPAMWIGSNSLRRMFNERAGYITFNKKLYINTDNRLWPFHFNANEIQNQIPTEEDIEIEQELEDTSPKLQEIINKNENTEFARHVINIRKRNKRIINDLKELYKGKCQITGEKLTFQKKNGEFYCEVHHLIPLGENGSDSFSNIIVVSPLIHRMLHYANISDLDLSKIKDNKLPIE